MNEEEMTSLLVISSTPATLVDEKPFLDIKFVEGMRFYTKFWNGPVNCILKLRDDTFPFGKLYEQDHLPFGMTLLPGNRRICAEDFGAHDVLLCSGDDHELLHLAGLFQANKQKLVFIIENIPETRRQIVALDPSLSLPRKIHATIWLMNQERLRRRAFRLASGLQANGYPAYDTYGRLNAKTMRYLESRVDAQLLATEFEMEARRQRVLRGAPVRLMHSGRLEPLKGSQDLVPVALRLASRGLDFTLDIFGTGSLEGEIRRKIVQHGLQGRVRLNGVADFETELVPFARQHADIYLSCHRQSDPSCSYIENMGCGLAVVGYANRMWSALCADSGAGKLAPLGDANALADAVFQIAGDRTGLAACCDAAHQFARTRSFEREFHRRIDHMKSLT